MQLSPARRILWEFLEAFRTISPIGIAVIVVVGILVGTIFWLVVRRREQ